MRIHTIAFGLIVIGGLNWLLEAFSIGIDKWGLPDQLVMLIYILIGLSAIYELMTHKTNCRWCGKGMQQGNNM